MTYKHYYFSITKLISFNGCIKNLVLDTCDGRESFFGFELKKFYMAKM